MPSCIVEEWTTHSCLSVKTKKLWAEKLGYETSNIVQRVVLYFVQCTKAVGNNKVSLTHLRVSLLPLPTLYMSVSTLLYTL
jgi:hypothetical protein